MLTREEDVDAHALRRQGWTISAIARHLGHDRKTIRSYLTLILQPAVTGGWFHDRFAAVGRGSECWASCGRRRGCAAPWICSGVRVLAVSGHVAGAVGGRCSGPVQ